MEFERSSVDGVPVFWTESGDEMLAGLVFRVGRADESLARGGITHLVEHLALYPLGVDGGTWEEDLKAVSVAQVREAGREALASSLFVLPQRSVPHRRLRG